MAIKKIGYAALLAALTVSFPLHAEERMNGDTIQIYTALHSIAGKPSWLLILRDMNSQKVLPYVYDIQNNYNFFIALPYSHNYRVVASQLKFGPCVINNFCNLEDGVISWRSLHITIKGDLTPNRWSSRCYVQKYKNLPFPLVGNY